MVREIDPGQTNRALAYEMWMNVPMPMVTLFKTLDVTRLIRASRRSGCKFNMLLCWCIGRAAAQSEEFYLLPVGDRLMRYDSIALSTVVTTRDGGISTCDVPFSPSLAQFSADYLRLTRQVRDSCEPHDLGDACMVIGTSALAGYDIDGAVNIYAGIYNNPFLIWGKYRKKLFKALLPVSFQFHHTQLDGIPAAQFLERLQREINSLHVDASPQKPSAS